MRLPCNQDCVMPLFSFFSFIAFVMYWYLTFPKKTFTIILTKQRRFSVMKTVQISLNSIGKVKSFVNVISQFEYDFDLISGRYVIDAKSIMGIFSLDLSKPIELAIHTEDEIEEILEALAPYIIE
jgi:phosphotransferase system HPr-like phosphotransfer protein